MKKSLLSFIVILIAATGYAQRNSQGTITCKAYRNPMAYFDAISKHPALFTAHSETGCIFKLLDTLTSLSIKGNQDATRSLDIIYKNSDGEVSEYFLDIGVKLFYKGFNNTLEYLFKNRNNERGNGLENAIIEALSMQISNASDRGRERKKIHVFIVKKEQELNIPAPQCKYLTKLENKLKPEMFD